MIIITYNVICTTCGTLLVDGGVETGLEAARIAARRGWVVDGHGNYTCNDCGHTGHPSGVREVVLTGPEEGYEAPDLICSCGTYNKGTNTKCRKCKSLLSLL